MGRRRETRRVRVPFPTNGIQGSEVGGGGRYRSTPEVTESCLGSRESRRDLAPGGGTLEREISGGGFQLPPVKLGESFQRTRFPSPCFMSQT